MGKTGRRKRVHGSKLSCLFKFFVWKMVRCHTQSNDQTQLLRPPGKPIPPYLMVKLDEVGSG
jgi:hypothetical protein